MLLLLVDLLHAAPEARPMAGPAKSAAIQLPERWWAQRALVQLPLGALVRAKIGGAPWLTTAQLLGFDGTGFSSDNWGSYVVQAHSDGEGGQDFAVYYTEGRDETYGIIARNRTVLPSGIVPTLVEVASRAGHGDTWKLYRDPSYVYLTSTQRPLVELGCWTTEAEPRCHAAIYRQEVAPEQFAAIKGNGDAQLERVVVLSREPR